MQREVYENIVRRGYRKGWNANQFAARQVCKLVEELGELASALSFTYNYHWHSMVKKVGIAARFAFDHDTGAIGEIGIEVEQAKSELADLQVVVFCLAAALAELDGQPFDVVAAAVAKSASDIERGVR